MDRLLTADELAERLGMKTEWVWAQARAGRIPHVRLGRYRRFRESAVEEWLRELETGGSGRSASTPSPDPAAPTRVARRAPRRATTSISARPRHAARRQPVDPEGVRVRPSAAHIRQQIDGQLMDTHQKRPLGGQQRTSDFQGNDER